MSCLDIEQLIAILTIRYKKTEYFISRNIKPFFPKFGSYKIDFLYLFYCRINLLIATEVICFPLIFIAIFSDIEYSTFLFIVAEIFVLFRQPNLKDWCWNIPLAHWKQKFGYWYPRRNQNNTCFVSSFSFFVFQIHMAKEW